MEIRMPFKRLFVGEFARRALLALLVVEIFFCGIQLRRWTWGETRHVRFQHDIVNGFYWGSETLAQALQLSPDQSSADSWTAFFRGYFAVYDWVKREAYENDYGLDYPPLRLLAMSIWAKEVRSEFPGTDDAHPGHVRPLLNANLFCELVSAVAIFLLVRLWLRRAADTKMSVFLRSFPTKHRAWICGLLAASVAWLEPSMILDAHGWPQWDVWIVPFYLFALLAALKNRWFSCGCLLAAGAMLKGQLLFVTPFFLFWPLWQKRWTRAFRVLTGFASTVALLASPWLLRNPAAWITVGIVASASLSLLLWRRSRHAGTWIAGLTVLAVFVMATFDGGSFAWLQVGFLYGSEHYPYLFISSCYNLASLLANLGWELKDPFWSAHFGSLYFALTLQWTLRLLYLGALALCALGAARHTRNRDPRLLIAIVMPWLLMFALLGQMHERYLTWGAVISAVALAVNVRLSVLHFIISLASLTMIAHVMLIDKKLNATLGAIEFLNGLRPYASGLVLVCVAVCLWDALPVRLPMFQSRRYRWLEPASLSVGVTAEEV
jgi:Glycosyltransferase family 87